MSDRVKHTLLLLVVILIGGLMEFYKVDHAQWAAIALAILTNLKSVIQGDVKNPTDSPPA